MLRIGPASYSAARQGKVRNSKVLVSRWGKAFKARILVTKAFKVRILGPKAFYVRVLVSKAFKLANWRNNYTKRLSQLSRAKSGRAWKGPA